MNSDELPICDVCDRPVESLAVEHDPLACHTVYFARCHGQVERVKIEGWAADDAVRIDLGRAFRRKRLDGDTC